jgi:hypothetical protein
MDSNEVAEMGTSFLRQKKRQRMRSSPLSDAEIVRSVATTLLAAHIPVEKRFRPSSHPEQHSVVQEKVLKEWFR